MTRILFVDDEVDVIDAMRRTLHSMRGEWSMEFAVSGADALAVLAAQPADVVVSDMRMPGMDGWEFLAKVKDRAPQTVRLILSGHADPSSIMRAVGIAHQYLAKPCDRVALKAAIAQTQRLRNLVSSERLAGLVGSVGLLPSAPAAFQQLLACLRHPTASLLDVSRIVERDVAMTATVMKVVNSAFFGARQTIRSIDRAVSYLGLDMLGGLVLGQGVFHGGATTRIKGFSLDRLWEHSLMTGALARSIAMSESSSEAQAAEAFLAGLLHDVGRVIFATHAAPAPEGEDVLARMDDHHAEVGAYLLGLWGFPNSIVEAVAFHHHPMQVEGSGLTLTGLLHVVDRLVHDQAGDEEGNPGLNIDPQLLEHLGTANRIPVWAETYRASTMQETGS